MPLLTASSAFGFGRGRLLNGVPIPLVPYIITPKKQIYSKTTIQIINEKCNLLSAMITFVLDKKVKLEFYVPKLLQLAKSVFRESQNNNIFGLIREQLIILKRFLCLICVSSVAAVRVAAVVYDDNLNMYTHACMYCRNTYIVHSSLKTVVQIHHG